MILISMNEIILQRLYDEISISSSFLFFVFIFYFTFFPLLGRVDDCASTFAHNCCIAKFVFLFSSSFPKAFKPHNFIK